MGSVEGLVLLVCLSRCSIVCEVPPWLSERKGKDKGWGRARVTLQGLGLGLGQFSSVGGIRRRWMGSGGSHIGTSSGQLQFDGVESAMGFSCGLGLECGLGLGVRVRVRSGDATSIHALPSRSAQF